MLVLADGAAAAMGKAQLDILRNELEDTRGEISSLIGQIEEVREDLIRPRRGVGSVCCCRGRRDLRKLEDRLWLRLHQLQEKENELHRQRTAILSRPIPDMSGDPSSPILRHQPPPVSPEAPDSPSPPWRQQQKQLQRQQQQQQRTPLLPDRRQLAPSSNAVVENHHHVALPLRVVSEAAAPEPVQAQRWGQPPRSRLPVPVPATRPLSLRRRPCRPGSAEDTGSGAE